MIDQQKRKTIKTIGVSGIGVATSVVVPSVYTAARDTLDKEETVSHVPFSGITITHNENPLGHTILLRNETDRAITLLEVSPGYISTPSGEVSLNDLFQPGDFVIQANGTRAVNITLDGQVERYASWTHTANSGRVAQSGIDRQFVSVVGRYDPPTTTNTLQLYTATLYVS